MRPRLAAVALAVACGPMLVPGLPSARAAEASYVGAVPVERIERSLHYIVNAADAPGLAREMAERGPQHPTGRRAWAYTAWELRSRYALEREGRSCRLLDPAVVLEVRTTLPRWEPKAVASSRLRSSWRRMLDRATAHEEEHRLHALDAARAAAIAIAAVPDRGDCRAIEAQVRSALRRASAEAMRRSRVFDRTTDYGRLQGVRLAD